VFNMSSAEANVDLAFTKDDGSPFIVTIPGSGTNSAFAFKLDPGAGVYVQTDGSGPLSTGAATITSNAAVGSSAMFTVFDTTGRLQTEAGVGNAPVFKTMTVPINVAGNYSTGVALFNPGKTNTAVTLRLLDDKGKIVGSDVIFTLGSKSHLAKFANHWFPGLSNFSGSLAISSEMELAALALRQFSSSNVLCYTTLPVASGVAQGTR